MLTVDGSLMVKSSNFRVKDSDYKCEPPPSLLDSLFYLSMAPLFRARRAVDGAGVGDGGAAEPPPRWSWWISGLFSGAGRLISSVFDPSLDDDSEEEEDVSGGSDEDTNAYSHELVDLNQGEKKLDQGMGSMEESLAIVTRVNPKHAFEQLLMQETFTREECDKLTKIIQSRVVDLPSVEVGGHGVQKKLPNGTECKIITPEARWSSDRVRKLQEKILYGFPSSSPLSIGSAAWKMHTPDLRQTAVMEAKKWLEEKRSGASSKTDSDCGQHILSMDVPRYYIDGEPTTPVEISKSYMRSLPPWQSPPLTHTGYWSMPSSIYRLYGDEEPNSTANHSLTSLKVFKRKYLAFESPDTPDDIRRVRLKSIENIPESSDVQQLDSSTRLVETTPAVDISGMDIPGAIHGLSSVLDAGLARQSAKLPSESSDGDHCLNLPLDRGHTTSVDVILDGEEATNAVPLAGGDSLLMTTPIESILGVGSEAMSCEPVVNLCEKPDTEDPNPVSSCVPSDHLAPTPTSSVHNEDTVNHLLNSEQTTLMEEATSNPSNADHASTMHIDLLEVAVQVESSMLQTSVPDLNECDPIFEMRSQEGNGHTSKEANESPDQRSHGENGHTQKETNESADKNTMECSPTGLVTIQVRGYDGYTNSTSSSYGDLAALGVAGGARDAIPSGLPLEVKCGVGKSRNGTTMRSIKRMLSESETSSEQSPGRKLTARPRRGGGRRGRGRSDLSH